MDARGGCAILGVGTAALGNAGAEKAKEMKENITVSNATFKQSKSNLSYKFDVQNKNESAHTSSFEIEFLDKDGMLVDKDNMFLEKVNVGENTLKGKKAVFGKINNVTSINVKVQ